MEDNIVHLWPREIRESEYRTSKEKHFIQFLHRVMGKLSKKYSEIYLLRNANLFKLYRFLDGVPTEPDFVLFLKEKGKTKTNLISIFTEAKGTSPMYSIRN